MPFLPPLSVCCCFRPQGYLYDKEAILEYILHQKREIARKMKEYERQKNKIQVGGTWCMELAVHVVFSHASSVIINASA